MNQITRTGAVGGGFGGGGSLIPQGLDEAMKLAEMMARGKLVPEHLRNAADMLMVIEQATRWRMSPFAVAQATAVVKGRLSYEGKLVAAALHSSGVLRGRLDYRYSGEGQNRTVIVSAALAGEEQPREVTVRYADAATTNEHWKKSPDQMLSYHGARVWARRYAPEVMLGVYSPEEFEPEERPEPREVQSTVTRPEPRPAPPKPTLTTAELDQTLNGDNWDLDAPVAPKPDGARADANRLKGWLAAVTTQAQWDKLWANTGVNAVREKIRAERIELDAELTLAEDEARSRISGASPPVVDHAQAELSA